jgi:hypothetical protein
VTRYWIVGRDGLSCPLDRDTPLTPQGALAVLGGLDNHFVLIAGLGTSVRPTDLAVLDGLADYFGSLGASQADDPELKAAIRETLARGRVPIDVALVYGVSAGGDPIVGNEHVRGTLSADGTFSFN